MIQRTTSKKAADFRYYGGRGITVCKRWREFVNFHADMASTYKPRLTLERIDNDRGYSPDNCRWATRQEQNRNTREAVVFRGETQADASKRLGLGHAGVGKRIRRGWTIEAAFTVPRQSKRGLGPMANPYLVGNGSSCSCPYAPHDNKRCEECYHYLAHHRRRTQCWCKECDEEEAKYGRRA